MGTTEGAQLKAKKRLQKTVKKKEKKQQKIAELGLRKN